MMIQKFCQAFTTNVVSIQIQDLYLKIAVEHQDQHTDEHLVFLIFALTSAPLFNKIVISGRSPAATAKCSRVEPSSLD